ncbi:MAG TPA: rRNA adenine N(6)-methyltransferase family protein [Pseudonocardiaceae bacterium]
MSEPSRAANAPGIHILRAHEVALGLVRSAGPGPGDLVLDVGAGTGAITAPLARTGARVLAIERNPRFVTLLRKRFAACDRVRVVHADAQSVPLPRRPYLVVASIPFAISTLLLRRLLNPSRTALAGAELIVQWELARRITRPCPRAPEGAWWAARHELVLRRRIPAGCFDPAPAVDAAHLAVRPRPRLDGQALRVLWVMLQAAYAEPERPVRPLLGDLVGERRARRLLVEAGLSPSAPAGTVPAERWAGFARALSGDRTRHWPALPRRLDRV